MTIFAGYLRELFHAAVGGWNRFWFTPSDAATLALIRICAGAMLLYTHCVWTLNLNDFFGSHSWVSGDAAYAAQGDAYAWSYFWSVRSPAALWTVHFAALAVFAMLAVGLFTRVVSILAFVAAVSYVNRVPGALFGLDQINTMLAMYLVIGPSGDAYSVDRLLARWRSGEAEPVRAAPTVSGNIAIRLIQLHMCVIYFFAGLAKLAGPAWWSGAALWGAVANLEYQSLDLTWLAHAPLVVALLTHITAYWELFFPAIVWPRLMRPIVLLVAVPLHLGIAIGMGMITFGLVMLVGCSSFLSPNLVRAIIERDGSYLRPAAEDSSSTLAGGRSAVAARRTGRRPAARQA